MLTVPLSKPELEEADISAAAQVIRSGNVVQGPQVAAFEKSWGAFVGASNSIAVSSGTAALHLALLALDIGVGDEVLVPAFTWVATANVVELVGARPIFVDIDLHTFNLDVSELEKRVTAKTKAIIPVHLFGLPAPMAEIRKFSNKYGLYVIEDAACAFGSEIDGRHLGTQSHISCFSFHPRKAITTGEGGMICTEDPAIATRARSLRNHGLAEIGLSSMAPHELPDVVTAGLNYRLTDFQAALGWSQLQRAKSILKSRSFWAEQYSEKLTNCTNLLLPNVPTNLTHSFQSYVVMLRTKQGHLPQSMTDIDDVTLRRNNLMKYLADNGIQTRPGTQALHMLDFYRNKYSLSPLDFPRTLAANCCTVSLPLFSAITEAQVEHVCECVKKFFPCI